MKKRLLSLVLSCAILGTCNFPIFAAEEKSTEVLVFDSFGQYTKEYTDGEVEAYPEGFGATALSHMNRAGYALDDARSGRLVKLGTGASMLLPIGKVFTVGKGGIGWVHLSFDMKLKSVDGVETSKNKKFQLLANTNWLGSIYAINATSNNKGWVNGSVNETAMAYDPDNPNQVPGQYPTTFLNVGADNLGRKMELYHAPIYNQWNTGSQGATRHLTQEGMTADTWHKFDIYIRQSNGQYVVYMDGSMLQTYNWDQATQTYSAAGRDIQLSPGWWNIGENKIKGFEFRALEEDDYCFPTDTGFPGTTAEGQTSSTDGGAFLLDNVYMKYYTTTEEQSNTATGVVAYEAPEITVDDNGGEGIAITGGQVNVGFSEWMSSPANKNNVTICKEDTGEVVSNFTIENSDNMQFDVVFDNQPIESGNYVISVSGITGAVSGKNIAMPGVFKTGVETQLVDGQNIVVPRVDAMEMVTYDGELQNATMGFSTKIEKIYLHFSTAVARENLESKITLKSEGEVIPYTLTMENGNQTAVMTLSKFMAEDTQYSLLADMSITAETSLGLSEQVTMKRPYQYSFWTIADGTMQVLETSVAKRSNRWQAKLELLKTDNQDRKYTMAVCVYQTINGVKTLTGFSYKPIELSSETRKMSTESLSGTCHASNTSEIKVFVMEYPTNKIVDTKVWGSN